MPHPQVLTMQCIVTNYGRPRAFPTRAGNIFLNRHEPTEVCDEGVLDDLKRFEQSDLLSIEVLEPSRPEAPAPLSQGVDYSECRINELRAIAAGKGVKGAFSMKKVDLIKKLEE
ncbi:hypothetical protein ES707_20958 [subsurface metagenome]